jgi:hypothetical protein
VRVKEENLGTISRHFIEAYLSWENLVLSVENILSNYGTEYVINFV